MGLETSKHAAATYQPKGSYATKYDLGAYVLNNDFNTYRQDTTNYLNNDLRKFTDATYQPKTLMSSYATKGDLDAVYNKTITYTGETYPTKVDLGNYQPKGDYITSLFKPLPGGSNGGYMTASKTYDVGIALKSGLTKGNAIMSLEDQGAIAIQSLDGNGKGSQLFLSNNGRIGLQDLSGKGNVSLLNGEVDLSATDKFCFNKTCFTPQDMQTLYNNLPVKQAQSLGDNVTVLKPTSQYLRTRNYMHY